MDSWNKFLYNVIWNDSWMSPEREEWDQGELQRGMQSWAEQWKAR